MPRTLILNFDGTWNGRSDDHITNVLKIHRGLDHTDQVPMYFSGPGDEDENGWFSELMGGAIGLGSREIRDRALDMLSSIYWPGDRIAVIGFSRGAAIARLFCAKLGRNGVNGHRPTVCFLGCFDTVGAWLPLGIGHDTKLFKDLTLSPIVQVAYHAVAIHEDRKSFKPNLMNHSDRVHEVWFKGVHGNAGGGLPKSGLSDIALDWMIEAMAEHGILAQVDTNPDPTEAWEHASGIFRRQDRRVGVRVDGGWSNLHARVHHSVQ